MLDFDREFGKVYNTDFIHNSAEVVLWPNPVNDVMNLKTNNRFLVVQTSIIC